MSECIIGENKTQLDEYSGKRVGGVMVSGHRAAWMAVHGPIPEGMWVLHKCDTPACVNVEHLFLGTPTDNIKDMMAKGRANFLKGSQHHHAKLNEVAVRVIRYVCGHGRTQASVARAYGISPMAVSDVVRGTRWAHVQ